jgi:hypothetical protein
MHVSFIETLKKIANTGWGCEYAGNTEEAEDKSAKDMSGDNDKLTAWSLLFLVRCLCGAADAALKPNRHVQKHEPKPSNAKAFPEKAIGDSLYCLEGLEESMGRYVIVSVMQDGVCRVVAANRTTYGWAGDVTWSVDWMKSTPEEAFDRALQEHREYGERQRILLQCAEQVRASGNCANWEPGEGE